MSVLIIRTVILYSHFRERDCPKSQDRTILSFLVEKVFLHRLQFNTAARVTAHSHKRSGSIPFSFCLLCTSSSFCWGLPEPVNTAANHCCQIRFCLFSKLNWLSDTFHKQQAEHKGGHRQISLCRKLRAVSVTPLAGYTAAQQLPEGGEDGKPLALTAQWTCWHLLVPLMSNVILPQT